MADAQPFTQPGVTGFLHLPDGEPRHGLVLTHGAGSDCRAALLVRVAEFLAGEGFVVLRCDLAFRQRRASGPPHPSQATADRDGLRTAVQSLRSIVPGKTVALGGHSYGGRQASMLAAEEPGLVPALLLLSYPLHPPNRPEQLRTDHFVRLQTPALFVSGTRDPFATPDELRGAVASIPAATLCVFADGAGHDLQPKRLNIDEFVKRPFCSLLAPGAI